MAVSPESPRLGRRPGGPDTRSDVLEAARAEFAAKGFDRTTIRGVATTAGVDAALVYHYFGSKDDLFLAALEIPFDPRLVLPSLLADGLEGLGERALRVFLTIWEDPAARLPLLAVVRSAMSSEAAADLLRSGMLRMIFTPLSAALTGSDAALRAQLVASQLMGLVMARYVLRLDPIADVPAEELVRAVAPTLQRYITG